MASRYLMLSVMTIGLATSLVIAADPPNANPVIQRDQQKKANAAVEQTARFVTTSLRILTYQRLDPTAEQNVLNEVATSLKKLSQDDMKAVLNHLETAVKAPNEETATSEQREAYQKHRAVVASLRSILFKMDILRSLDEAAKRVNDSAKAEFSLHQRALLTENNQQYRNAARGIRRTVDDREEQADGQTDLRNELTNLIKQLALLRPKLNPEQKDRLDQADAFGRSGQLVAQMEMALQSISAANYRTAAEQQLKTSKELQSLAAALATPRDPLTVMKETRDKIEQTRRLQEALKQETEAKPEVDPRVRGGDRGRQDVVRDQANKLAEQQGKLEFETRESRKALEQVAKEVAAKLTPAESEMRRAQDQLRQMEQKDAPEAQANAAERLKETRDELDKLIELAEKQKSDPLEATKKAAEMIDKLIKDQKSAQELTKKIEAKPESLKPATEAQKDVAKNADEVKKLPLPENEAVKEALEKAAEQTKAAATDLAKKDAKEAQPKQAEAVKALEKAKKALEEQAAMIEKRRDEIAKLQEAAEKLADLAKQEKQVADDAKTEAETAKNDTKPETSDLAKKQGELTPPTKEVGEMVKDAAPKAAEKIDSAAKNQDKAKAELGKNEPMKGSEKANEAAKNLDEAKAEVSKKIDELQAKEIADQAALQPNKVSPMDAAAQIAKAIEQTKMAADQASQAGTPMKGEPKPGDPKSEALQKSAEANAAAQAALTQAQAQAPMAVKPQLDDAAKQLSDAAKELGDGKPAEAGKAQSQAAEKLENALSALNAAASAMGQPTTEPGQNQQAQAGMQPGMRPGMEPGDGMEPGKEPGKGQPGKDGKQPGKDGKPGDSQEQNQGVGEGDRQGNEKPKNSTPTGKANNANGNFINLQKQERDKVQQNAEAAFPAEFRELIKQYNINIKKNGKPQIPAPVAPTTPAKK